MKILFDENMPALLVQAMSPIALSEGDELGHILTQFGGGTPDIEWLAQFGDAREWVVISRDGFNKTKEEKKEIAGRARCAFILAKAFASLRLWELMGRLLLKWPEIKRIAEGTRIGAVYSVPLKGARIEDITRTYV